MCLRGGTWALCCFLVLLSGLFTMGAESSSAEDPLLTEVRVRLKGIASESDTKDLLAFAPKVQAALKRLAPWCEKDNELLVYSLVQIAKECSSQKDSGKARLAERLDRLLDLNRDVLSTLSPEDVRLDWPAVRVAFVKDVGCLQSSFNESIDQCPIVLLDPSFAKLGKESGSRNAVDPSRTVASKVDQLIEKAVAAEAETIGNLFHVKKGGFRSHLPENLKVAASNWIRSTFVQDGVVVLPRLKVLEALLSDALYALGQMQAPPAMTDERRAALFIESFQTARLTYPGFLPIRVGIGIPNDMLTGERFTERPRQLPKPVKESPTGQIPFQKDTALNVWADRIVSKIDTSRCQYPLGNDLLRRKLHEEWLPKVVQLREFGGVKVRKDLSFDSTEEALLDLLLLERKVLPLFQDNKTSIDLRIAQFEERFATPSHADFDARYQPVISLLQKWFNAEYEKDVSVAERRAAARWVRCGQFFDMLIEAVAAEQHLPLHGKKFGTLSRIGTSTCGTGLGFARNIGREDAGRL